MREAGVLDVRSQLVRELSPAEPLPPGARVHLVDRQRSGQRIRGHAVLEPRPVAPLVSRAEHGRGGVGRRLGTEGDRVCAQGGRAVRLGDGELVPLPLVRGRSDAGPDPRRALRVQRVGADAPEVPVPDDRHGRGVGRPDREPNALLLRVGAEHVPQPLVPTLPEQEEVEVADAHVTAHRTTVSTWACPGSSRM